MSLIRLSFGALVTLIGLGFLALFVRVAAQAPILMTPYETKMAACFLAAGCVGFCAGFGILLQQWDSHEDEKSRAEREQS